MDGSRFDDLTRSLTQSGSRRRILAGLAAGVLSAAGSRATEAATCRPYGSVCREHANCCSHLCGPKDAAGRQKCVCVTPADCPVPGSTCQKGVCVPPTPTTTTSTTTTASCVPIGTAVPGGCSVDTFNLFCSQACDFSTGICMACLPYNTPLSGGCDLNTVVQCCSGGCDGSVVCL